MTSQRTTELGYAFAPLPHRVRVARRRRRIDADDVDILAALYGRANFDRLADRQPTPIATLAQVAESVAWPHTHDALSKRLRSLRDDGFLGWSFPHKGVYLFTLYPDDPVKSSENDPSSHTTTAVVPDEGETHAPSASGQQGAHARSDSDSSGGPRAGPSSSPFGPSSTDGTNVAYERDLDDRGDMLNPSSSERQSTTTTGEEGKDHRAREGRASFEDDGYHEAPKQRKRPSEEEELRELLGDAWDEFINARALQRQGRTP